MSNRATELNINLYSDHTHPVTVRLYRERISTDAATVISEPRPSWLDNLEATVRYDLTRLMCEEWINLCGLRIQRTDAQSRITFHINGEVNGKGTPKRFSIEETIQRILAA